MSRQIEVLFVIPTLESCGPTTMLFNIVKHLDRTVFDAAVLTLSPEPEDSYYSRFISQGIPVFSLGLSRVAGFLVGRRALKKFLRKHEFDIINTHGFRPDLLALSVADKVTVVSTVHNDLYADYCMSYGRLQGWCMAKLHRRAMSRLAVVVGCSEYVADSLRRLGLDATFIRNGVDTDVFHPAGEEEKAALRERLEIPAGTSRIAISVGSLSRLKNPLAVIDGFLMSGLKETGMLILLGDGPLRPECVRRAKAAGGNILVARGVANVQDYLKIANCLISASKAEGLPTAVIEGLACGVPACLSDISPHVEIRNLNPTACELFKSGDASALASALDRMMAGSCVDRIAAAKSVVAECLNAKRMSEEYQALFRSTVAPGSALMSREASVDGYIEPEVTVGIPFYSATNARELKAAIDSILDQSHRPSEIHLIQDGPVSTEVRSLIEYYLALDERIRHIFIEKNMGLAHALNRSIMETTTPYYARMDSDDVSHRERFERQLEYLESHPEIDVVGLWANEYYDDDREEKSVRRTPLNRDGIARRFHYRNPMIHATVMFRTSVFSKLGLYDPSFPLSEDYQLWGRAINAGIGMANIPEVLYDIHAATMAERRAPLRMFFVQVRTRFTCHTWSPALNAAKVLFLAFMLMPRSVKEWVYRKAR